MNKIIPRYTKWTTLVDIAISASFLYYSISTNWMIFLFQTVFALPVNWIILFYIFSESSTVGLRLHSVRKYIFPIARVLLVIIILFAEKYFKYEDFQGAIFLSNRPDIIFLSLSYHTLRSIITLTALYLLIGSIIHLFTVHDIYDEHYDPKHKETYTTLAILWPFILLGLTVVGVLIWQLMELIN